nr:MAG TPA: hypothetical protein [Caudoviricetes sp.]
MTRTILAECIPAIEQAVDKFVTQIKEQAKDERGWCATDAMPSSSLQ